MPPHRRDRRRSLRSLYVWHRWLGILSAVLVLWLSATGIALNHTDVLGLDRWRTSDTRLLRLYGMYPQPPETGYAVAGNWISQAGGKLFFNATPVDDWDAPPVGVATLDGLILVAGERQAVLLTQEGQIVERRRSAQLEAERDSLETRTEALPAALREQIGSAGAGLELSGSRVLADLHSGRVLGRFGTLVMDLAATGFMVLAMSGLWLWWRFQQGQRRRDRRQRMHHP